MKESQVGEPSEREFLQFRYSVVSERKSHHAGAIDDWIYADNSYPVAREVQRLELRQIVKGLLRYGCQKVVAQLDVAQLGVYVSQEDAVGQVVQPVWLEIDVVQLLERVECRRLDTLEVVVVHDEPQQVGQRSQGALGENVSGEGEAQLQNLQGLLDAAERVVVELRQVIERQTQLL